MEEQVTKSAGAKRPSELQADTRASPLSPTCQAGHPHQAHNSELDFTSS